MLPVYRRDSAASVNTRRPIQARRVGSSARCATPGSTGRGSTEPPCGHAPASQKPKAPPAAARPGPNSDYKRRRCPGRFSRYAAIASKLLGAHQCSWIIGQTSGGSLRTSPMMRSVKCEPFPLEMRESALGKRREPRVSRPTPTARCPAAPIQLHVATAAPRGPAGAHSRRKRMPFAGGERIHQHQPAQILSKAAGVLHRDQAAEGMPGEHKRTRDRDGANQPVQIAAGCYRECAALCAGSLHPKPARS